MSFLAVIAWTLVILGVAAYLAGGCYLVAVGPKWWLRVLGVLILYSLFVVGLMLPT